jgi:two-component system, chemotaxis family, protein-glutamate methylesterase/glutaminase
MSAPTCSRDIVVIGCSAGGVEALPRIVQQLPREVPASFFIVQHLAPSHRPYLVDILKRVASIPIAWAEQGARIERGHIYVAPPDVHMIFTDDHISLNRGARENYARPSIDKLFRSAAAIHGNKTIGVLLTGMMDDGVAGLGAIHDAGGHVIVQDPSTAAFPDLPTRAVQMVAVDQVLPIDGIGNAIVARLEDRVPERTVPPSIALEAALDRQIQARPEELAQLGQQTPIACPDCSGPTWQLGDPDNRRYRCYLGHVNSARELLHRGSIELEAALWSAIRALNERAITLATLANDTRNAGNEQSATVYETRAKEAHTQADLVRQFMRDLTSA